MNWKSTLALVLLAGGAGVWFFMGDEWGPKLGLKPAHPEPPKSEAVARLDALSPAALTRVEIALGSGEPLVLERSPGGSPWKMPGNWPLRVPEVTELVETIGNLRTRFHAVPLPEDKLGDFGLAESQKPLVVRLIADGQPVRLTFGEPPLSGGDTPFTRPAFVRIGGAAEVLKLGPDVMPIVRRSADAYRRRQLFSDVERVKIAGVAPAPTPFGAPPGADAPRTVSLPSEETDTVTVRLPAPRFFNFDLSAFSTFTLLRTGKLPQPGLLTRGGEPALPIDRLADAWVVAAPHRDPAEPGKLRSVLAATADLWVDEFVPSDNAGDAKFGFDAAAHSITVKPKSGEPITVRFGAVAKTTEREETISVPAGPPGTPPRNVTRKVPVEHRYARIDGNPQVFVVSAERFPELFVAASEVIDPRVARFEADEVESVALADPLGIRPTVKLARKKGNPKAIKPEEREDRWFLDAQPNPLLADAGRVNELLDRLANLKAEQSDRRSYPELFPPHRGSVTVVARERRAEGEPDAPARTYSLVTGPPDAAKRLLPVRVEGAPRLSLVEDKLGPDDPEAWVSALLFPELLSASFERPPITYRSRKLFDTAEALDGVTVAGGFSLQRASGEWKLVTPLASDADPAAANALADGLSRLTATEFLADPPTPSQLTAFGLEKPKQSISLAFAGGRKYTLDLGAPRPGRPEVFARLDGGAVFGLPNATAEQLTTGAVGLLPLKVWAALPEKVTGLEITRTGDAAKESFALAKDGTNWKLTGPFAAPVPFLNAQPLVTGLGNLSAVKYQALSAANDAEYGFDKPLLKVKLAFSERNPTGGGDGAVAKAVVIGGTTPDGANRYAKLDGPNTPVFVIPAAFVLAAQTPPLELLDRSLLLLEPGRIAKVKVATEKADGTFTLAKDEKGKWAAEGIAFAVDPERITRLTSSAAFLPVVRLAAYGDAIKWADFGLEKPEATVTVTLAGEKPETHTIALGKADPTGGRFARVDDKPAVAVLPPATAESLLRKKFEYADRTLFSFDPTTLVGLTRTAGKDTLELAPAAAVGWDIVKPTKQKADPQIVEELADALSRLRADRVAAFGKRAEVFKQHGLETAAGVLTVTVGDKAEEKALRIGNPVEPAKPDGDRYVAVEGTSAEVIVGVLPAALANKLLAPAVAFRDRSLAKFVDADKAVLERGDRKITFAKVGVTWKVTEPLATGAESAELEALVADLGKLRADTWVAEKGNDLKPFGLDKPEAQWALFDGDKPVLALRLGKKNADGRVHVATDKGDLVGLLDPATTARVLGEYRQRRVWDVDAAQLDSIDIGTGGAKFTLEKAGPLWADAAKPTDAIDARVVNELLGTLGALRAERYAVDTGADPKLFGLDKPEATIAVPVRGVPTRRVLEIGAAVGGTDGKQRYARVADKDRGDVFVLSAADTARLTRDRAAYLLKK